MKYQDRRSTKIYVEADFPREPKTVRIIVYDPIPDERGRVGVNTLWRDAAGRMGFKSERVILKVYRVSWETRGYKIAP